MKLFPKVEVHWIDPHSTAHEWTSLEQVVKEYLKNPSSICSTTGYLIYQDDKHILVAGSLCNKAKEVGDVMIIPMDNLTKLTYLASDTSQPKYKPRSTGTPTRGKPAKS